MAYFLTVGESTFDFEEDEYWNNEWGARSEKKGPLYRGEVIDKKYLPKSGYINNKLDIFPKLLCRPYWLCDDDVKDEIERIDENIHLFIPIDLRIGKFGSNHKRYYIINIISNVDAVDTIRSDRNVVRKRPHVRKHDGGERAYIDSLALDHAGGGIVLEEDKILGSNLWIDKKLGLYGEIFISEKMFKILEPYILNRHFKIYKTE